jgi:hypothetical protein
MSDTPAGWYPDPSGGPQQRYWDGAQWTDQVQAHAAPAAPQPPKKKRRWCRWVAPSDESGDSASGGDASSSSSSSSGGNGDGGEKKESCGTKATSDCTPRVGPNGSVTVDALKWRIASARSATELGDQTYGLGEKADGVFVIVDLEVTSSHDESVTLSDSVIKLETEGTSYEADNDGTVAAIGAGEEPFFLESLGPDSTMTGTVVFDLPESKLGQKLELRFGELGFGETHGYIRLPRLG